ncbi:MAG: hypothetical protein JST86_13790 [Bacteroidetes bacterium]|nr:hypothetical protein [Bacteroidota bacterium]
MIKYTYCKQKLNKTIDTLTLFVILLVFTPFYSCHQQSNFKTDLPADTSACGCKLNTQEMILQCPVKAVGDSVVICKVGTISVAGSKKETMTWPEYMASKYMGAEGSLTNCKTGKQLFNNLMANRILTYRDKQVWVDRRISIDIYEPLTNTWSENIELPAWRNIVYASKNEIFVKPDTLIFKPPFINPSGFKSADSVYRAQSKQTFLYSRTVNRLLACALCGDTVSERRLLNLEKDFPAYFSGHAETKLIVDEKINLLLSYQLFLKNGGKRVYFDLSVFPYYLKQMKPGTKARTTLKPLDE